MEDLSANVANLAAPLAGSMGLALWGVEVEYGPRFRLRVYVDNIGIEQCADLSRLLGLALDAENLIPGSYVLEVSSPGLDRIFFNPEQLAKAVGARIELGLREAPPAFPGRKNFKGILRAAKDGLFYLAPDAPGEPEFSFAFSAVGKVRQIPVFPEKTLPGKGAGGRARDCREANLLRRQAASSSVKCPGEKAGGKSAAVSRTAIKQRLEESDGPGTEEGH
ncbi:MAG: ribosome maturation factor RimP [Desulfovibrio sp.]|jgi:ribosome maturation factor RimP|nr:ribosome maturation factor RimP [Desulfovibrio sp.]